MLVKHQLRILNRSRKRAPKLRASERIIARFVHPFHEPDTRFTFRHRPEAFHSAASPPGAGETKGPQVVVAQTQTSAWPERPNQELVDAVVELKRPDPNLESRGSGIENKRVTGKTFMRFRCAGKTGKVVGVKDSSIIITGIERTPDAKGTRPVTGGKPATARSVRGKLVDDTEK